MDKSNEFYKCIYLYDNFVSFLKEITTLSNTKKRDRMITDTVVLDFSEEKCQLFLFF